MLYINVKGRSWKFQVRSSIQLGNSSEFSCRIESELSRINCEKWNIEYRIVGTRRFKWEFFLSFGRCTKITKWKRESVRSASRIIRSTNKRQRFWIIYPVIFVRGARSTREKLSSRSRLSICEKNCCTKKKKRKKKRKGNLEIDGGWSKWLGV